MASSNSGQGQRGTGGPSAPAFTRVKMQAIPGVTDAGLSSFHPKPVQMPSGGGDSGNQGFLGWLGDILSRPLYGVTNVLHDTINSAVDQATGKKTLGEEFVANPLGGIGSFLSGMFSTNPDTHRTTSQLIEGSTDKIGSAVDPNYKNTVDNVNPWIKGISGFAGDILLDPLTWIPGGAIVSGARTAGKALKTGAAALTDAVKGADKLDSSVSKAVKDASAQDAPTASGARDVATLKVDKARDAEHPLTSLNIDTALPPMIKGARPLDEILRTTETPHAQFRGAFDVLRTVAPNTDKAKALKALTSDQVGSLARPVLDTAAHEPLDFPSWVKEARSQIDAAAIANKPIKLPSFKDPVSGKKISLNDALEQSFNPNMAIKEAANRALKTFHQSWYRDGFRRGQQAGALKDALLNDVNPVTPVAKGATETVASALTNFQRQVALNEEDVRKVLGDNLTTSLQKFSSPANFEKTVTRLSKILDGSTDLTTLKSLEDTPTKALLRDMGLIPEDIPHGLKISKPKTIPTGPKTTDAEAAQLGLAADPKLRQYQEVAGKAVQDFLDYQLKGRPFKSARGASKTEQAYGAGQGRWDKQITTQSLYTLLKSIDNQIGKQSSKIGAGEARALWSRDMVKNSLRLAEHKLEDMGVPMTMGLSETRFHARLSDLLDLLDNADPQTMLRTFWNKGSAVPVTNLMKAAELAVHGKAHIGGELVSGDAGLEKILRNKLTDYGQPMPNSLVRHTGEKQLGAANYAAKGGKESLPIAKQVESLKNLIIATSPQIRSLAKDSAAEFLKRTQGEVIDLTDKTLSDLQATLVNAKNPADLIAGYEDITPRIKKLAEQSADLEESPIIASEVVKSALPVGVEEAAKGYTARATSTATKIDTGMSKGKAARQATEEAIRENASKTQSAFDKGVTDPYFEGQSFVPNGNEIDFGKMWQELINEGVVGKFKSLVSTYSGQGDFRNMVRAADSITHSTMYAVDNMILKASKLGTKDQLVEAFRALQQDIVPPDATVAAMKEALAPAVNMLFGRGGAKQSALDHLITREGMSLEHVNRNLQFYGMKDFLFDLSEGDLKRKDLWDSFARQWMSHAVTDPGDYLHRSALAMLKTTQEQSLVNSFISMADRWGGLSAKPRPGYAKITNNSGDSAFAPYLSDKIYAPEEVARQFQVVDAFSRNLLKREGPAWQLVKDYYQPLLGMWKTGVTIVNPSHHIRNFISDASLTFLVRGAKGTMKAYKDAAHMMATRNSYDGYDFIKALNGMGESPNIGKVLIHHPKFGDLTADTLYHAAADRGLFPTFQHLEQLADDPAMIGKGKVEKLYQNVNASKPIRFAGGVSEARDHYVRSAHFAQFIANHAKSGKYKTVDDLFNAAANEVRKWHPDGSDLTNFEKTLRLIIPFYSWTRHAIPLIAESVLTHPARVTAFNKASFNMAVAMGINPDSLSNPWPADQVFPNYLTDQAHGPSLKLGDAMFNINPGVATWDVLKSTVAGNPLQNIMGQVTPGIKVPFELATGTNAGTGAPITSMPNYIESQIPVVSQASRITGISPLDSIMQGQITPTRSIQKGNTLPGLGALNWLLGGGLQQVGTPSQVKYAQLEQRNNGGK